MVQQEEPQAESRLHVLVHGRVQGVSFRYYTQRRALELGVSGWVRNEWDGSVQVVAEGPRSALAELLAFLSVGPRGAVVSRLEPKWLPPTGGFSRFEVRY